MVIPEWTKKIEYGLINETYLLRTDEILRISNTKINKLIDRKNEIEILKILQENKCDFTPDIIDYGFEESNTFFLKTKYLPFSYNLVNQKIDTDKIDKIFEVISQFRKINITNRNIKKFNWKKQINLFKSQIKNPQIDLTQYEIELVQIFKNYEPQEFVLSHNDLSSNNFLFNDDLNDKKVYLIDFEYACINDKLYDIASLISETLINEKNNEVRKSLIKYWTNLFQLNTKEIKMIRKLIFYQNILSVYKANAMFDITKDKLFLKIIELKYHEIKKMY